jgi:cellobiose phosphorylase
MHAATWALAAACKRGDVAAVEQIWNAVSPPTRCHDAEAYRAEPYVMPGNVDGPLSETPGKAGWTWYTGSAAWLNRVSLEWVCGLRASFDGLTVDPRPFASLGEVEVVRHWRGRKLTLRFNAAAYDPSTPARLEIDGRALDGNVIGPGDIPEGGSADVRVSWSGRVTVKAREVIAAGRESVL